MLYKIAGMRFTDIVKKKSSNAMSVRDGTLEYFGSEIGKQPADKLFRVYRSPATISNAERKFHGLPVCDGHVDWDLAGNFDRSKVVGRIADSKAEDYFDREVNSTLRINNTLEFNDQVSRKDMEMSLGYNADIVDSDFPHLFDYVQENIAPHHLAVVDSGRCGPSCKILDKLPMNNAPNVQPVADAAPAAAPAAAPTAQISESDLTLIKLQAYVDARMKDMPPGGPENKTVSKKEEKEDMKDMEEEEEKKEEMKDKDDDKKEMGHSKSMDSAPVSFQDSLGFKDFNRISGKARELSIDIKDDADVQDLFTEMRKAVKDAVGDTALGWNDRQIHSAFLTLQPVQRTGQYKDFGKPRTGAPAAAGPGYSNRPIDRQVKDDNGQIVNRFDYYRNNQVPLR